MRKVSTKISPVKAKHFIASKELRDGGILMKGPIALVKGAFFFQYSDWLKFFTDQIFSVKCTIKN